VIIMPIRKVKGGYKWGSKGKVYRNRKDAERQAAAAYASGYKKSMDWFDTLKREKHPALKRAGVSGFSKPKRTPKHPTKSHVVVVRDGKKVKTIRFGQQGADTVTEKNPKGKRKKKQASFKARHAKNIKRGKTSAAYWANKVKW